MLVHPDATFVRSRDLKKKSSTISSLEKEGTAGSPKPRGEDSRDQVTGGNVGKRPKSPGKGPWDSYFNPPSSIPRRRAWNTGWISYETP